MKPSVIVNGERWNKFFADYHYADATYSFEFYARSKHEAVDILRAIRTTAVECHEIEGEIACDVPCAGLFVKLYCAIRNLFGRAA